MKDKFRIISCVIAIFPMLSSPASAEEPAVQPHEYKQGEIDIQTDFIYGDTFLNQRNNLSEEQHSLTFEQQPSLFYEKVETGLFDGNERTSTIAAKTEQLQLFSKPQTGKEVRARQEQDQPAGKEQSRWLLVVLGLLVISLVGYLFFVLVPKINKLPGN